MNIEHTEQMICRHVFEAAQLIFLTNKEAAPQLCREHAQSAWKKSDTGDMADFLSEQLNCSPCGMGVIDDGLVFVQNFNSRLISGSTDKLHEPNAFGTLTTF